MKQLVQVNPKAEIVIASDKSQGWTCPIPDVNPYKLVKTFICSDYRHITPLQGNNIQIWLLEGGETDIGKFVADNSSVVSKLTAAQATTLVSTISPARSGRCSECGATINIPAPVISSISP